MDIAYSDFSSHPLPTAHPGMLQIFGVVVFNGKQIVDLMYRIRKNLLKSGQRL